MRALVELLAALGLPEAHVALVAPAEWSPSQDPEASREVVVLVHARPQHGDEQRCAYYLVLVDRGKGEVVLFNSDGLAEAVHEHARLAADLKRLSYLGRQSATSVVDPLPCADAVNSGVLACVTLLLLAHYKDAGRVKEMLQDSGSPGWYKRWRRVLLCLIGGGSLHL